MKAKALARAIVLLLAAVAVGCGGSGSKPPTANPVPVADDCADRLHDISGAMLEYYLTHGDMPATVAELARAVKDLPPCVCPVSGRPYIYNPVGLQVPGRPGNLIMYDATPAHNGMRRTICASESGEGTPVAHVLSLTEAEFARCRPVMVPVPEPAQPGEEGF